MPEVLKAFVYILRCADGTLYTGWTNDLAARLRTHQAGKGAKYTRARRPVTLVYYEVLPEKCAALRREAAIKRLSRAAKLHLIANAQCTNAPKVSDSSAENCGLR